MHNKMGKGHALVYAAITALSLWAAAFDAQVDECAALPEGDVHFRTILIASGIAFVSFFVNLALPGHEIADFSEDAEEHGSGSGRMIAAGDPASHPLAFDDDIEALEDVGWASSPAVGGRPATYGTSTRNTPFSVSSGDSARTYGQRRPPPAASRRRPQENASCSYYPAQYGFLLFDHVMRYTLLVFLLKNAACAASIPLADDQRFRMAGIIYGVCDIAFVSVSDGFEWHKLLEEGGAIMSNERDIVAAQLRACFKPLTKLIRILGSLSHTLQEVVVFLLLRNRHFWLDKENRALFYGVAGASAVAFFVVLTATYYFEGSIVKEAMRKHRRSNESSQLPSCAKMFLAPTLWLSVVVHAATAALPWVLFAGRLSLRGRIALATACFLNEAVGNSVSEYRESAKAVGACLPRCCRR